MKQQLLALLTITLIISSCSKKEKDPPKLVYTIDKTEVSMKYDKSHQYVIKEGSTEIDASKVKFTSSNEVVGTIDQDGLFDAKRIGSTTIKAEGAGFSLTSVITVEPYSNLCKEPYYVLGIGKAAVKTQESRMLLDETATGLVYKGENTKVRTIIYLFEGSGLNSAAILFQNNTSVIEESVKFFSERYEYQGESDDVYFFANKDVLIGVSDHVDLGFNAIYLKNTTGKTSFKNLDEVKSMYLKARKFPQLIRNN